MTRKANIAIAATLLTVAGATCTHADYRDEVGYTLLTNELGSATPAGIGIPVTQVEAGTDYMPDITNAEFIGKTFTNATASSTNTSDHATAVGKTLYGNSSGMATSIQNIVVYQVPDWAETGFLHTGEITNEPAIEANRVQNHSWIGNHSQATNAVRRLDYAIERDGFFAAVGIDNTGPIPQLMGHSYNAMVVGLTSGNHSTGTTLFDEPGRVKPDIVAPSSAVSGAVPIISAGAALLLETIDNDPALTNAAKPECIKAILMAGATKDEFLSWDRTHARPLDETYGAGELNIYNSYHILTAGQQTAGSLTNVPRLGWDYGPITQTTTSYYFFAVAPGSVMTDFSAILTWNRLITDSVPGSSWIPVPTLANLDMRLLSADNFVVGREIDLSTSTVDNVEHIRQEELCVGQYAIEITADAEEDYALAWISTIAPTTRFVSASISNACFAFSADVSTNETYTVQVMTNMLDTNGWTDLATNTAAQALLLYVDTDSTNHPRRFYRLLTE